MTRFATLMLAGCACAAMLGSGSASAQHRAERGEAELAKAIAGRVAGRPVHCISLSSVQSTRIMDRTAIVYESGRTLYVNRPRGGASTLDRDDVLVTKTFGGELCSPDTVRLVDRGSRMPHGFVSLGEFVPYTLPRKHR